MLTKEKVLEMIDQHKNKLLDPVEMLHWTYLRIFINQIDVIEFRHYMNRVVAQCSN